MLVPVARQHQHRPPNRHQVSGRTTWVAFLLPKLHLGVQGGKEIGWTLTVRLHLLLLQSFRQTNILYFPGKLNQA